MEVKFYESIDDTMLKFVVIVTKHHNQWVFCKHKERSTYECQVDIGKRVNPF